MKHLFALLPLLSGLVLSLSAQSPAAAPFFKPDDVVALVGGEDMAVMRDYPDLEVLIVQQPGLSRVKFRNLAAPGDTVFEQFRDLNFPSWEDQLKKIGATVVISQFGKMESFRGIEGVSEFIAAYEKLLDRFSSEGRRIIVMSPWAFGEEMSLPILPQLRLPKDAGDRNVSLSAYIGAEGDLAKRRGWRVLDCNPRLHGALKTGLTLGGLHPIRSYYTILLPRCVADEFELRFLNYGDITPVSLLWDLTITKNRLWFNYWRPQNWAFLNGDRTEQPSSRDHLDPKIRWFPAEMEKWMPLIEGKEREIAAKAAEIGSDLQAPSSKK